MTVSFTRWSSSRNASSAAFAAAFAPGRPVGGDERGDPLGAGIGQLQGAGRARDEAVDRELVDDRLDLRRVGEDRVGDAGEQREPLDRDDPEAHVGGDLAVRRGRERGRRGPRAPRPSSLGRRRRRTDVDAELRRPGEQGAGLRHDLGRRLG